MVSVERDVRSANHTAFLSCCPEPCAASAKCQYPERSVLIWSAVAESRFIGTATPLWISRCSASVRIQSAVAAALCRRAPNSLRVV